MKDICKIKTVCDFYAITHKLKNTLRVGWQVWEVDAKRFESVAEHIYGTQMLAFAVNSEFGLGLDIVKIAFMMAFHELAETVIGDISVVSNDANRISKEQKHDMELVAIKKILTPLNDAMRIESLWLEFEQNKTAEAKFARWIDKLECDMQVKFYEETGCNSIIKPRVGLFKELCEGGIKKGYRTLAKMWIEYDKEHFEYDALFTEIADYIADNDVFTSSIQLSSEYGES